MCILEFTDATGSLFGVSTSAKNGTISTDIHVALHYRVMCLCRLSSDTFCKAATSKT